MRDIDDKMSKANHDLKLFRGQYSAYRASIQLADHVQGSWIALQGDSQDLEKFATEPHIEQTDAFMRVELASLLEGWTRVRDEGKLFT